MCYFKMQQGYEKKPNKRKQTTKNGSDQTTTHIHLAN